MPIEESDKRVENTPEKTSNQANEAVSREADEGKPEFAQKHVQYIKDLKDGVIRSGVSQLLGKPKFFDSQMGEAAKKAAAVFNTGEVGRLALNELRAKAGFGEAGSGGNFEKAKAQPSSDSGDSYKSIKTNEGAGERQSSDGGSQNFERSKAEPQIKTNEGVGEKHTSTGAGQSFQISKSEAQIKANEGAGERQAASDSGKTTHANEGDSEQKKDFNKPPGERSLFSSSVSGLFGKPVFYDSKADSGAGLKAKGGPDSGDQASKANKGIAEEFAEAKDKLVKKVEAFTKPITADMLVNKAGVGDKTSAPKEVADPEVQKLKDAKLPLSPEQEKQLKSDMEEINKLPEDQRKKVLESLDKIASADTNDTTKLDPKQRAELVTSLAHQVAHPESIKQGAKDTCVSANVEKTLAMTHPDQYADMVAQLSTKGQYTTPDGKHTVKAQRDADGKLAEMSDPSGQRSATSELTQTAITNLGMPEGETYKSYKPGKEPIPDGVIKAEDSGERVVGADGKEKRFEGLSRTAKEDILNKLTPDDGYTARKVTTAEDLGQAWKDNGGKPPLNVTVRINAEHTGMGQAKDGAAGTHAVTITHMEFGPDGKSTQIYYENTADSTDHSYPNGKPVPADDFVKSMQNERSNTYKDGSTDRWSEPMTATVRTDGKEERQSKVDADKDKDLDKAVEEFRDGTHKDAFIDYGTDRDKLAHALQGRPRWEIEEINRRYKEKYGHSLDEDIVDELDGKERIKYRQMLKGNDTQTEAAPPKR